MLKSKLLGATAAAEVVAIEDVFSTYLFTGTGAALTINNGIDLAGEGGLVWQKSRTNAAYDHNLFDTARGVTKKLLTNTNLVEITATTYLTAFNANGFSVGSDAGYNQSGAGIVTWTFRQAPQFFDVVTYTGTGANRTIAHDLGVVPGCIIVKRRDTTGDWQVYHRSLANTEYMMLNDTAAKATGTTRWNSTTPTSSVFSLGTDATVNASGGTYVAYLFAHDPLGPSGDGSDGLIACGSYTGTGTAGNTINLGWEPQWLIIKCSSTTRNWLQFDNMRGLVNGGNDNVLFPNLGSAESPSGYVLDPLSNGFSVGGNDLEVNGSGQTYIYIAIRRGPMREPTVGTEVFDAYFNSSSVTLGQSTGVTIVPDFVIARDITAATRDFNVADRLRGAGGINPDASFSKAALYTNTTGAEVSDKPFFDIINKHGNVTVGGEGAGVAGLWGLFLKRAPGFFDVVAYTGNGVAGRTVPHNLGVAPELMIVKTRNDVTNWRVYHKELALSGKFINLDVNLAAISSTNVWGNGTTFINPTDSVFTVGSGQGVNDTSKNLIWYGFATLPGISKVGSYTGNGSNQTINCGFTTGARFILIKRTDSTGDWYAWDTKQGIVSGNDPRLKLNDPGSQVTTDDSVDPDSSGFIVNQLAATDINVSSASYIFMAIS